ncbi:MAG: hypothetical protein COB10_05325 [Planctomycetota bacterium]|nr:MAG: hypothetical protein COB10_05325 [Planctomycetota bacterium]
MIAMLEVSFLRRVERIGAQKSNTHKYGPVTAALVVRFRSMSSQENPLPGTDRGQRSSYCEIPVNYPLDDTTNSLILLLEDLLEKLADVFLRNS